MPYKQFAGVPLSAGFLVAALFLVQLPVDHLEALRNLLLLTGFVLTLTTRHHEGPAVPVKGVLLLWAGVTIASVGWSQNSLFSLREIKLEVLLGMMLFWLMYRQALTERHVRLLAWAVATGVMLTSLFAIYRIAIVGVPNYGWSETNDPWTWQHGFVSYSTYLSLAFPLMFYLLSVEQGIARIGISVILLMALWSGWATQNRMLWVVLGLCLLVGAGIWYQRAGSRLRSRWLLLLIGSFVLAGLAAGFVLVAHNRPTNVLSPDDAGGWQAIIHTFTQSDRLVIWHYWLGVASERPWLGMGFGRDLPHMIAIKPAEWPYVYFAHAHNVFIDILLQLGIVGLVVFVILLASLVRRFWLYTRADDKNLLWIGMTGLMVLTAFAGKNFTDDMFWRTDALIFWALMGMLLGAGERGHKLVKSVS